MYANFNDIITLATKIPHKTEYWFVRTDDGRYFDEYTSNNYIAIGWNNISLFELRNSKYEDSIRAKLIESEELDADDPSTKGKVTGIINKLQAFDNLKKGDVVLVPSRGSQRIAFGIIKDGITLVSEKEDNCKYQKRKEIIWQEVKYLEDLDAIFYKIKSNRHSISNIDSYGQYIDKVINTLFIKDDNVHYVIDLKTQEDINVVALLVLIDGIQDLINKINIEFNLNERVQENAIKLNLQSPGKIEFKLPSGQSLVLLALILSMGCSGSKGNTQNQFLKISKPTQTEITNFINNNQEDLKKIDESLDTLEGDRTKINSF